MKLKSRTTAPVAPVNSKLEIKFTYDAMGRRIRKQVTSLDTGSVLKDEVLMVGGLPEMLQLKLYDAPSIFPGLVSSTVMRLHPTNQFVVFSTQSARIQQSASGSSCFPAH